MSFDSQADNKAFAEKYNFNFPLLCDTERTMGEAYGASPGATGSAKRIGVVIAPDGTIKEYEPKVVAKSYPSDVLQRL